MKYREITMLIPLGTPRALCKQASDTCQPQQSQKSFSYHHTAMMYHSIWQQYYPAGHI